MTNTELLRAVVTEHQSLDWYKKVGASSLMNFRFWQAERLRVEDKRPAAFFGLYADHRNKLKELWGKQTYVYRSEYAWHGWVIPLAGEEKLIVMSAAGGGTTFEVAGAQGNAYPPQCSERSQARIIELIHALNDVLGVAVRQKYAKLDADPAP
jgi:hypothetical protein